MSTPDHLAVWLRVRETVPWRDVVPGLPGPIRGNRDGFADVVRGRTALSVAYEDMRRETAGLSPALLARWNRTLRDVPVAQFRRGPAFAKNGRERYGLHADTERRFAACLAGASDPDVPAPSRAARVYLDVAFFHPYDDGNARLAALALQFVLLRAQIQLDEVTPIVTVVRRADDAEGAAGLARLIHGMAAATHRRARASLPLERHLDPGGGGRRVAGRNDQPELHR